MPTPRSPRAQALGHLHLQDTGVDRPVDRLDAQPIGRTFCHQIGQVSGCQTNFEVGDPLSGTTFADTVGSFTYHPQELAFFSWFYHSSPSLGVNGWYSNQGKFTASATKC